MPEISDHDTLATYNKGDLVKVTEYTDDAIMIDGAEFSDINSVLSKLADKDWSKTKAGDLRDQSAEVFLLDAAQIEQISISLGNQPNIDFFPSSGGYFAITQKNGDLFLEPVENKVESWQPNKNYSTGDMVKWGFEYFQASTNIQAGEEFSETFGLKYPLIKFLTHLFLQSKVIQLIGKQLLMVLMESLHRLRVILGFK